MNAGLRRGDIIRLNLDPTVGEEIRGRRPALVLTSSNFHREGEALIAPISQGADFARFAGFAVTLTGSGCATQGVALVNKIRVVDVKARCAVHIERAPAEVVDDALERLSTLLA